MQRLPNRGAYAVYLYHELTAVLGYDLELKETYLHKLKDLALEKAEGFVNDVQTGIAPVPLRGGRGFLERWELYGLPSGAMEEVTRQLAEKLSDGSAILP